MVDFYQTRLQLKVESARDWFIEFKLTRSARLSIADESRASIKSSQGGGITLTFEVSDLTETHRLLQDLGLHPLPVADHSWGARVFYLFDPEGNRLEFWSTSSG